MQSMTGFGGAETGMFSVEIRSVNHRFFDVYFRMPSMLNRFEVALRRRLKKVFSRGRLEVNIAVKPEKEGGITINDGVAAGVIRSLNEVKERFSLEGEMTIDLLAAFKDILITDAYDFDDKELFETFDKAVSLLKEMRVSEGAGIKKELSEIVSKVDDYIGFIVKETDDLNEKLRLRVIKRFRELFNDAAVDEYRLIQEASILAEKADITEEIKRLQSHVGQFRNIIGEGEVVGKKLDFLLQEFMREANTIASKTSEYEIISTVVDMKNEIEKLRELVQNIQ